MLRSLYQGIAGMKAMNDGLSITGNNIANVKTTGYKSKSAMFNDLFTQTLKSAASADGKYSGSNPIEVGNGVKMGSVSVDQSQGTIYYTGRTTDAAISGNGYFVVGDKTGNSKQYTRAGNFELANDNSLVTSTGQQVLGWNADPLSGQINTTSSPQPIMVNIGQATKGTESTNATLSGNLNATNAIGDVEGATLQTYDRLGTEHDVDMNFIKTGQTPNTYTYVAAPANDVIASPSISGITFHPSLGIASSIQKGDYTFDTTAGAMAGTVDITVKDPSGTTLMTKTVTDADQTVSLDDGTNTWFTINYIKGGAPSTAKFQVAEVGTVTFDPTGNISAMTGSGTSGNAKLDFTPIDTGVPMSVAVDIRSITGVNADNALNVTATDGKPSTVMRGFTLGDGGAVMATYSDGSTRQIGTLAVASFANPSGLQQKGDNLYEMSGNSGPAVIGVSAQGDRGKISAQALENSNVDLAKEFVDLMEYQKGFTANTKTITTANNVLDAVISLIR